jgi:AraC-like DNA-binding protein
VDKRDTPPAISTGLTDEIINFVLIFEPQYKQMIYIVGISISFFLCLLLLTKKGKTQADKILTAWLLLISVHLLLFYLFFSGVSYQYPFLLGLIIPLPLLHGPFLLLYTASLTNQLTSRKKLWPLHFVPALACLLFLTRYLYFLPADQKVYIFQNKGKGFEGFVKINLLAIILSGICYVIWSLILLRRHRKTILNQFSYTEKINLRWLQLLIYGLGGIWILVFASDEVLFAGVVLFIVLIGYFGSKQPGIFTTLRVNGHLPESSLQVKAIPGAIQRDLIQDPIKSDLIEEEPASDYPDYLVIEEPKGPAVPDEQSEKRKYSKSGLTEEMAEQLHSRLRHLMKSEKIYTESELSLTELASRLNTPPNYLSQVINDKEGKTFYDYINTLRIEEFKRLISLPESKKYTLLSLSFDCGFNSKSSFNKNFKKVTGQSPSEFINNLVAEEVI